MRMSCWIPWHHSYYHGTKRECISQYTRAWLALFSWAQCDFLLCPLRWWDKHHTTNLLLSSVLLLSTNTERVREREINGHCLQLPAHLLSSLNEVRGGAAVYFFKAGDNSDNSCNWREAQLVPVNPVGRVVLKRIRPGLEIKWCWGEWVMLQAFSSASVLAAIKAALWWCDRLVIDYGSPNGGGLRDSNMYVGVMKALLKSTVSVYAISSSGTCIHLNRSGRTPLQCQTRLPGHHFTPNYNTHVFSHSWTSVELFPWTHCCSFS